MAPGWHEELEALLDSLELWAKRLLVICGAGMIVLQLAMVNPAARRALSVTERLDGLPYTDYTAEAQLVSAGAAEPSPTAPDSYAVSFELVGVTSLPDASVTVNGVPVADFSYPVVTVEVSPGDLLGFACAAAHIPVDIRVKTVAPGLATPRLGDVFRSASRVNVGRVTLAPLVRR